MSWTRQQFISQAFEELGLASYVFDLAPEQLQSAARRLDSMMAAWDERGVKLGFPLASNPDDIALDQDTGVPSYANEAVYLHLALRIAPSFGKAASLELKQAAKDAYDALLAHMTTPAKLQIPSGMPAGAGNRNRSQPFLTPPDTAPIGYDESGQLTLGS